MTIIKFQPTFDHCHYINFDKVLWWYRDDKNSDIGKIYYGIKFCFTMHDGPTIVFKDKETRDNALQLIENCINCPSKAVQTIHTLL